jgi:hypothetical protein
MKQCELQGKTKYGSELDAKLALLHVGRKWSGTANRVYRCGFCNKWHLTSKPYQGAKRKGHGENG